MNKVISFEECQKLWDRDSRKAAVEYGEEYVVKFNYQKEDGFWAKGIMMFCSSGKDDHEDVEKEFHKRFPNAEIISVRYQ